MSVKQLFSEITLFANDLFLLSNVLEESLHGPTTTYRIVGIFLGAKCLQNHDPMYYRNFLQNHDPMYYRNFLRNHDPLYYGKFLQVKFLRQASYL